MARFRRWLAGTCVLAASAVAGGIAGWQQLPPTSAIAQSTPDPVHISQAPIAPEAPDLSANLPPVNIGQLNRFHARIGGASVAVSVVELDASQPGFQLRPFWASPFQVPGLMDTQSAAQREGADIVINGGFFSRITHQPLGALKVDNHWVSSPILGRGVMAWNDRGDFLFDRMQFYEEAQLSSGETLLISDLNSGYFRPGFSRYTPVWGRSYTTETDNEVALVVVNNRITDIRTANEAQSLTVPIPNNGFLLVARQTEAASQASLLSIGTDVEIDTRATPDLMTLYPHAIGAGPLLMKDGSIVLDAELEQFRPPFPTQRAARSAVGLTADRKLLLVTAGKGEEDTGITLGEMAVLMQQLGSQNALNLDGGTSSTLYMDDRVVNFNGSPPRVHNYLGIFQN